MKYKVTGNGDPLVLVHGALTDLRMWHAIEPLLAASFQVFSITQRYFFGGEPGHDRPFGYETHARDLAAFLQETVKAPAHLVAWSYGADVCLLTAKVAPELIRSAFLYELGRHTHLQGDQLDPYFLDASAMFGELGQVISMHGVEAGTEHLVDASACQDGFFEKQPAVDRAIQLDNAFTLPLQKNRHLPWKSPAPTLLHCLSQSVLHAALSPVIYLGSPPTARIDAHPTECCPSGKMPVTCFRSRPHGNSRMRSMLF